MLSRREFAKILTLTPFAYGFGTAAFLPLLLDSHDQFEHLTPNCITPNHQVFTVNGWQSAAELQQTLEFS